MTLGVDLAHGGLPCRVPTHDGNCRAVFRPQYDTVTAIAVAGSERNAHERIQHGYTHVETVGPKGDYNARFSKSGRSMLSRRGLGR